jgi:glutaconate CoA-transferase subunit B
MIELRYSLAELMIVAAAQAWRDDGEIMGTGIGPLPRLGVSLCKLLYNPALATTDGECWYTSQPLGPGGRTADAEVEGWSPYDRVFSGLWGGKRHAMVSPVQIDRFGQTNISVIGDHARPKSAMLGARGFPGNSVHHANSFFFTAHNRRAFVPGEVDYVCSAGYNPARYPGGEILAGVELRSIVTNLAVLDFGGPQHAIRVVSLHPGVGFDEVQDNTGFDLVRPDALPDTPAPTAEQLELIAKLDPKGLRSRVLKDDPPGDRRQGGASWT